MRGSIWSVVALGTMLAFMPVVLSDSLATSADSLGSEFLDLIGTLAPVMGALIIVAATGLFLSLYSNDGF
jgi:uncharacterized membrane protein (DUF106 family)